MSEWKEPEFGRVPNEWEFTPAQEYCTKVTDGTHDSPKRKTEGKYLITSKHIKGRNIDFENAYLIDESDFNKINERSQVDQWDVIISMIGEYCGFTYVERNPNIDYAVKNVGLFKADSRVKALWLHYFLNSPMGKMILDINKSGSSQPYISLGALRNLPILDPSENVKIAITSVLSSLDDKIDLLHRQNKTLEAMAETLFRQWFVEGEVDYVPLGECVKTTSGGTPSRKKMEFYENGKHQWVKSKELNRGYILETEEKITDEALKKSSAKLLPRNSILIAMYGATVGQFAIIGQEATCNQAICACIPNADYPYTFIYYSIKANEEELKSRAVGSAQQNISQVLIKSLEIAVDKKKIKDFHQEVDPMMTKIKMNYFQIRTLTALRDTLLPKLMSGEIRIKK